MPLVLVLVFLFSCGLLLVLLTINWRVCAFSLSHALVLFSSHVNALLRVIYYSLLLCSCFSCQLVQGIEHLLCRCYAVLLLFLRLIPVECCDS